MTVGRVADVRNGLHRRRVGRSVSGESASILSDREIPLVIGGESQLEGLVRPETTPADAKSAPLDLRRAKNSSPARSGTAS